MTTLARTQYAFTAHVRTPTQVPCPSDIAPERMAVYRELLRNNIDGSLDACFPVLRSVLPQERWGELCEDFFARHRCRTPIYRRVPDEFLAYLQDEYKATANDPPFLTELAHYEWVELALSIDVREIESDAVDRNGDLWNGVPYVSPLAWILEYRYPVHRIRAESIESLDPAPTFIVVYRDRNDAIGFIELNAVSVRLLNLLQAAPQKPGSAAVAIVARELGLTSVDDLRVAATELLEMLRSRDVILGTVIQK